MVLVLIAYAGSQVSDKFLSLKEGYTGSSESTHVKMPHCWTSHVTAHMH